MKKTTLFLAIILCASCHKRKDHIIKSTKVVVIQDLTDSFLLQPQPAPVLALFDFAHDKDQEAALDLTYITDRQLNPVQSVHLNNAEVSEENNREDDVHFRDKLIQNFYSKTTQLFATGLPRFRTTSSLDHSEVFCTVISQARKLAASHYQKKVLIVFSDLQENATNFNAYSEENGARLNDRPEEIARLLASRCNPPGNLKGLTIVFVFQPKNREEDSRYLAMAQVYQLALENREASILFQANADKIILDNE